MSKKVLKKDAKKVWVVPFSVFGTPCLSNVQHIKQAWKELLFCKFVLSHHYGHL
jgi:hypothetical protein